MIDRAYSELKSYQVALNQVNACLYLLVLIMLMLRGSIVGRVHMRIVTLLGSIKLRPPRNRQP